MRGSAIAPFTANLALSINVIDLDGAAAAANPVIIGSGAGIAFSTGATQFYGRLVLRSAVGSELLDLPMQLITQYYAGTACIRNSGKPGLSGAGCAAAAPASLAIRATALAGDFNLIVGAPGNGYSGAATVSASAPAWLQYVWNSTSGTLASPSAIASFGIFSGPPSRVYQREVY